MLVVLKELIELIKNAKLTLSCAESCTGGYVASILTSIPGASEYFVLGCIPYSNRMKNQILGIPEEILEKYGAVSNQVAALMAEKIRKISDADVGLSTTGYAGPATGDESEPIGTIYIGLAFEDITIVESLKLDGKRTEIIESTTNILLYLLFDLLKSEEKTNEA